ncbi:MAG: phospholipase D family protein, partial [Propionivibrio sp.]
LVTADHMHPQAREQSGIYPIPHARDAFAARALLARAAEQTLDVQYYIWRGDLTGTLLLTALLNAAERGVRVRLLLDDNGTSDLDSELAALDAHPNVEIRLFNPFTNRSRKWLGYLTDFSRANRRMHNKSFTVDNQASIVGGRNVADEYFGATDGVLFSDLDVLAVGPIVNATSADFDRYWSSESAYSIRQILPPADPLDLPPLTERAARIERDPKAAAYVDAIRQLPLLGQLLRGDLPLMWAKTRLVSDDPAKGRNAASKDGLLTRQLAEILGAPKHEVFLISPYFVPTAAGVAAFTQWVEQGVKVRVLTNSFEATDVAVVHAGYSKHRKALLAGGVVLYELRSRGASDAPAMKKSALGSSGSSLHAKTFVTDASQVFVGSFNFDPRSINLNTELGFVIDSPDLAADILAASAEQLPASAYEVRLNADGNLVWIEQSSDKERSLDTEPGAGFWQRLGIRLLSLLPIEWLL